ncbi:hypothetical protein ACLKA7_016827 [Drosophila subpalustris]
MTKVARLEHEIQLLRHELAILRFDRDELYRKHGTHLKRCAGGDCCKQFRLESDIGDRSQNQDLYIAYLEDQIKQTRLKYQKQMGDVKSSASQLENKLQKVRQEMNCITARVQQVDELQKNVQLLKYKLQRRDAIIARYNGQYNDFAGRIKGLDHQSIQEDIALDQIEAGKCECDSSTRKCVQQSIVGQLKLFVICGKQ